MSKGTQLAPYERKLSTLEFWDQRAAEHQQLVPVAPLPAVIPDPLPEPELTLLHEPQTKQALDQVKFVEFIIRIPPDEPDEGDDFNIVLADIDMNNVDYLVDPDEVVENEPGPVTIQIQWPFTQTLTQNARIVGKKWTRADLLTLILLELRRFEEAAVLNEMTGADPDYVRIVRALDECAVVGAVRVRQRYWVVLMEEHL